MGTVINLMIDELSEGIPIRYHRMKGSVAGLIMAVTLTKLLFYEIKLTFSPYSVLCWT